MQVVDASGKPASGLRIQYACVSAACNYGRANAGTDADGMFTLPAVEEYYGTSWITVQFVGEAMKELDFHLLATDPPKPVVTWIQGAHLVPVAGDNQNRPREGNDVPGGNAEFDPMAVRLTAPDGTPIANAPIHFQCEKVKTFSSRTFFACQFIASEAEKGDIDINTDGNGVATLNRINGTGLHFYYNVGTHTMQATYGSVASYTFHFTVSR